jgi:ubiquitin-protein ligase
MTSIIDRQYSYFNNVVEKHGSAAEYFGIDTLNINYSRTTTMSMQLDIRFVKKGEPFNFNLPIELIRLISSYSDHYVDISVKILFPKSYPFRPPVWLLKEVKHNIKHESLDIKKYYKHIVHNHNTEYGRYWYPSMSIEKNILMFIERVNHFEYLFE